MTKILKKPCYYLVLGLSITLFAINFSGCNGENDDPATNSTTEPGATSTGAVSGNYIYDPDSGTLTVTISESSFPSACGLQVGINEFNVIELTATSIRLQLIDGDSGDMTWIRESASTDDVIGEWYYSDEGNEADIYISPDGTLSVTGTLECDNSDDDSQQPPPSGNTDPDCGDNLLAGFDMNLSSEGALWNYWKGFQSPAAPRSGEPSCFSVMVHSFDASGLTDEQVGVALYADNNGELGTLLRSGYEAHYNWEIIGVGMHSFPLDTVHSAEPIVAGRNYWLMLGSSTRQVRIERDGHPDVKARPRRYNNSTDISNAPPGNEFEVGFTNGGYSWSIW